MLVALGMLVPKLIKIR